MKLKMISLLIFIRLTTPAFMDQYPEYEITGIIQDKNQKNPTSVTGIPVNNTLAGYDMNFKVRELTKNTGSNISGVKIDVDNGS